MKIIFAKKRKIKRKIKFTKGNYLNKEMANIIFSNNCQICAKTILQV